MMSMEVPYEATGRTRQKARTRTALVDAARELLADGVTPTVEQAADSAGVARATAYRYFANQRALLVATYPEIDAPSLVDATGLDDVEERLDAVARSITRQMVEHETELRTMLRLSLDPDPERRRDLPFRTGRRIAWVKDALAPLEGRLPPKELDRLTHAAAAGLGIEALVWLTDMAGLSRKEAAEVMRWSALSLLRAALAEGAGRG
jgi:AcrR family transcriptional regulator